MLPRYQKTWEKATEDKVLMQCSVKIKCYFQDTFTRNRLISAHISGEFLKTLPFLRVKRL